MRNIILAALTLCLSGLIAIAPAQADNHAKGMPDEATMKKMMELGMPGEAHKVLEAMVGEWEYTVTFKMAPDAPEQTSSGTSMNAWILGGRFIQQTIAGTMDMGGETQKFDGIGLVGHDNMKGEYNSIWIDSMNTGMMTAKGTYDAATKTIKESGHYSCPMKGAEVAFESELQFVDADHYTYTMYDTGPDGKKFKGMEIKYSRKK